MIQLSWRDLFTDDPSLNLARLVEMWPNTIQGQLRPIGMSAFGDLFFERRDGRIERLDVLEGGTSEVARSAAEFSESMNTVTWQEQFLLSQGVALLTERGVRRNPNQCFAFAPHPSFVGKLDWERVVLMDAPVWHSICSQLLDGSSG